MRLRADWYTVRIVPDIEREIRSAALALLYEKNERIKQLEAYLASAIAEIRKLAAENKVSNDR